MSAMSDDEIRSALREIDSNEEITVTSFEADFLESVLFKFPHRPLSEKQRAVAQQILERYGYDD